MPSANSGDDTTEAVRSGDSAGEPIKKPEDLTPSRNAPNEKRHERIKHLNRAGRVEGMHYQIPVNGPIVVDLFSWIDSDRVHECDRLEQLSIEDGRSQ